MVIGLFLYVYNYQLVATQDVPHALTPQFSFHIATSLVVYIGLFSIYICPSPYSKSFFHIYWSLV